MIRTLDASMLNLPYPAAELAPLAAKYGFEALSQRKQIIIHVVERLKDGRSG